MSCHDFQEQLFEYLDGTLPTGTQQGLDQHLASCRACQQALARHQQLARKLSGHFCQSVESLRLDDAVRRRVLAALPTRAVPARTNEFLELWWRRLAWPLGIACFIGAVLMLGKYEKPQVAPHRSLAREPVSIKVQRVETTYTFRKDGELVTDALLCRTNVICETLWANLPSKPVIKSPVNKFSL